jgi:hypothetical protein
MNEESPLNWKSRLQSKTVRALVLAAIVTTANAVIAVSGIQLDVAGIEFWSDIGMQLLVDGFTLGLLWKAYKGRVNADTVIKPLPWKQEIKSIINKGEQP